MISSNMSQKFFLNLHPSSLPDLNTLVIHFGHMNTSVPERAHLSFLAIIRGNERGNGLSTLLAKSPTENYVRYVIGLC